MRPEASSRTRRRPKARLVVLGVLAFLPTLTGTASADRGGAAPSATSGPPQSQRGHAHDRAPCPPPFLLPDGDCSHGPDEESAFHHGTGTPSDQPIGHVCEGNGQSGRRTQVVYARSSDRADRYAAVVGTLRNHASVADAIYYHSAQETSGNRRIRFVHGANCGPIDVVNAVMPATGDDNFSTTVAALRAMGMNSVDRLYMVFLDATPGFCGQGHVTADDQPGFYNDATWGNRFGITASNCWGGEAPAHELMHNMGGVQLSAPHSSGAWHCTDEWDRMCYDDEGAPGTTVACSSSSHDHRFDCNHDDYFHTSPPGGSYLGTHWNSADNQFLVGAPAPPTCTSLPACRPMNETYIADFDGDLKADTAVWRPTLPGHDWHWISSLTGAWNSVDWGQPGDIPVPADYDGDGKADFAVFRADGTVNATANWYILQSSNGTSRTVPLGVAGDVPVPSTYDADAKADPAVFRGTWGDDWHIRQSTTNTTVGVDWGQPGDTPVGGDFDGDGRTDRAVWRPVLGGSDWHWVSSSNGSWNSVDWGQPGDQPVVADFDGDGRSDFTVWRPTLPGNDWHWISSLTGIWHSADWGQPGDVPVAADFDGDLRADVAVWRPVLPGTDWYWVSSLTGVWHSVDWGQPGDVAV